MAFLIAFEIVLYSLACLSLGLLLMRWLKIERSPSVTQWASAFLLGQGTLASLWLLLALAGWFYPMVVASFTIFLALAGVPILYKGSFVLAGRLRSLWQELRAESVVWQGIALLEGFVCLYFVTTLGAGLTGDALSNYMGVSKLVAASHHLVFGPVIDIAPVFGLQGEMHYAAFISLGNADAARLFDWPTLLAGAVMLLAICRRVGMGRRGLLIALAMFLTSFAVLHFTGMGKVDRFAMALALAAIYWAMLTGFSWLTGYFAGIAVIAKLNYLPYFLPTVIFLAIWRQLKSANLVYRQDISVRAIYHTIRSNKLLLPFCTGFFLAILPFLVKTLFLPSILQDKARMVIASAGSENTFLLGATPVSDIIRFYFRFPFDATYMLYESMSPLILAFIPLALLLPRNHLAKLTPLWAVTMAAVGSTTIWLLLFPNITAPVSMYYGRTLRYYLPTVLLFIPLSARAAEYACNQDKNSSRLLSGIVMGSVLLTLATTIMHYTNNRVFFPGNTYRYLVQEISECDLPHEPNYCAIMQSFNRVAPPGARALENTNIYWLRPDLIECAENIVNAPRFKQQSDLWSWIHRNGFGYLIVSKYDPVLSELVSSPLPEWVNFVLLLEDGPIAIYRLDYAGSAGEPEKVCRQTTPGLWKVIDR